jgi:hypothetical protein
LSRALKRYYDPLRLPLGRPPLPGASGYRRELLPEPRRFGAEEALSSSHDTPSGHSTPPTPEGSLAPAPGSQVPSMAFATGMQARLPLGPLARGFLTTPQASLDAADWPVAPRPASTPGSRPTPGAALPGTLASPRTGLPPAGCRELVARLRRGALLSMLLGARATGRTFRRNQGGPWSGRSSSTRRRRPVSPARGVGRVEGSRRPIRRTRRHP